MERSLPLWRNLEAFGLATAPMPPFCAGMHLSYIDSSELEAIFQSIYPFLFSECHQESKSFEPLRSSRHVPRPGQSPRWYHRHGQREVHADELKYGVWRPVEGGLRTCFASCRPQGQQGGFNAASTDGLTTTKTAREHVQRGSI